MPRAVTSRRDSFLPLPSAASSPSRFRAGSLFSLQQAHRVTSLLFHSGEILCRARCFPLRAPRRVGAAIPPLLSLRIRSPRPGTNRTIFYTPCNGRRGSAIGVQRPSRSVREDESAFHSGAGGTGGFHNQGACTHAGMQNRETIRDPLEAILTGEGRGQTQSGKTRSP